MTRPNPAERLSAEQILQEFFAAAQESKTTYDRVASPSLHIQGYSSGSSGFTPTTITSSSEAAYAQLESVALLPTRSDSTNSRAFNSVKPSRKISERCGGHLPCLSFGLFVILLLALTALAIRLLMRSGIPSVESSMITTTTPESLEPRVEAVQIKPQEGAKPTKPSIVPSCPNDWRYMAKTKSCYFKIPQMKTYPAAAKECKNLGSSLVSIHSRDEAEFVDDIGGKYYYWIGLNTTRGRRFEWLDGTDLDYQHWEQGRNETEDRPESCVARGISADRPGKWISDGCESILYNGVCKKSAGA